ncbi:uncharacterized protein LOC143465583 isoform X2 [Clavelina lepadiformis]|uniref:uncharacterized protein LOC143465583 isoform X2 n=1 Tax=Clavelina lepadiformis TaxID=159417 RepID=UPI004041E2D4
MSKVNLSEKTSTEATDEQTPLILNIEYESDGQVEPAQDDSAAPLAGEEKPSDLEPLESDKTPTNLTPQPTPKASSTPRTSDTTVESARKSLDGLTEEQLLELQTRGVNEKDEDSFEKQFQTLSVSRTDISSRGTPLPFTTGLPSDQKHKETLDNSEVVQLVKETPTTSQVISRKLDMGNKDSKGPDRSHPKYIITEEPQRQKIQESEITGNCRPWSDHIYHKLFLDTEGRHASLMVLKCEISYVDVFTDEEHSLYKCRFIGGKADGVAQLFVFDMMKSDWEDKIPQSQAIELNVDIVMSSSPIHVCSETFLNLLQLEKTYLKRRHFDGQLNVMIRFAHAHGWDVKDDALRERIHEGLRNLYREGVTLEVMSADVILQEMGVDGITLTNEDLIDRYIEKRHTWRPHGIKKSPGPSTDPLVDTTPRDRTDSSASEEDFEYIAEDDMYHVFLLDKIDQILANQYSNARPVVPKLPRTGKQQPARVVKAGSSQS